MEYHERLTAQDSERLAQDNPSVFITINKLKQEAKKCKTHQKHNKKRLTQSKKD